MKEIGLLPSLLITAIGLLLVIGLPIYLSWNAPVRIRDRRRKTPVQNWGFKIGKLMSGNWGDGSSWNANDYNDDGTPKEKR